MLNYCKTNVNTHYLLEKTQLILINPRKMNLQTALTQLSCEEHSSYMLFTQSRKSVRPEKLCTFHKMSEKVIDKSAQTFLWHDKHYKKEKERFDQDTYFTLLESVVKCCSCAATCLPSSLVATRDGHGLRLSQPV